MPVTREEVLEALRPIVDPDLGRSIVDLGFVKNVAICDGEVAVTIELTTPACPVKDRFRDEAKERIEALAGVSHARVLLTADVRAASGTSNVPGLEGVKNVVAVASGKGGVGKSTVAVHLALALAEDGAAVGLLDADIYGPSVPRILGLAAGPPAARPDGRIDPVAAHGVQAISMGLLADERTPVVWRGPMATQVVRQFLGRVAWGDLDYLVIDLPPGTGDIQLTIAQAAALAGAVIVTTPQDVATAVAGRGLRMFQEVNVPILGIVENMAGFVCAHCGRTTDVFGAGGGEKIAAEIGVPLLGRIPLDPAVAAACDRGEPCLSDAHRAVARNTAARLSTIRLGAADDLQPARFGIEADHIMIAWRDGTVARHPFRALRAACTCAGCRSETTGERLIREEDVPADVRALDLARVGLYAIRIIWSDGHSTGLYTFKYLREIGQATRRA